MTADELATTCIADEAGNQAHEGRVAIGVVILNRMARRFESDGTVAGTVLKRDQFSGFWFSMVHGHYTRVAHTREEAESRAEAKFAMYVRQVLWGDCQLAWADADAWFVGEAPSFNPSHEFAALHDAVNYVNLTISQPVWATADKFLCKLGAHSFYRS